MSSWNQHEDTRWSFSVPRVGPAGKLRRAASRIRDWVTTSVRAFATLAARRNEGFTGGDAYRQRDARRYGYESVMSSGVAGRAGAGLGVASGVFDIGDIAGEHDRPAPSRGVTDPAEPSGESASAARSGVSDKPIVVPDAGAEYVAPSELDGLQVESGIHTFELLLAAAGAADEATLEGRVNAAMDWSGLARRASDEHRRRSMAAEFRGLDPDVVRAIPTVSVAVDGGRSQLKLRCDVTHLDAQSVTVVGNVWLLRDDVPLSERLLHPIEEVVQLSPTVANHPFSVPELTGATFRLTGLRVNTRDGNEVAYHYRSPTRSAELIDGYIPMLTHVTVNDIPVERACEPPTL